MPDFEFYLGRRFDLGSGSVTGQALNYNSADLTTHAVVTGMTGSGKTGLCVALMEEAALDGIPAILIDPKGDLTNLLLHFPDLAPQDFAPWLDADTLRRQGKSLEQASQDAAGQWREGLAEWGISADRLRALQNAAQFGVFTPGSDAGLQVSVLSSLESPDLPWEGNREILREKIASTVTALLGLVGYADVDPLRSREHILLSNIFEHAWSRNKPLDLTELILQVQTPPFDKLGAFPVENFFPSKERTELAMTLNNILASPAFQSWREGQPMHIPDLLFTPEGKPRHSVFYLAHLSEGERMFFVTLLLSAFETWMRTQSGSSSLRALLYFDELFGYLPPQRNPPSKIPLLRMLKQARAFGVGLVLATQNPADIDYKGLSNAGTWFVGKLQTEWDKQRLLDGLQSATADLDRPAYNKIISALGKRVFLLHNIHEKEPVLFQTRWAMNFLAGPLTRSQIPGLNRLAGMGRGGNAPGAPVAFSVDSAPGSAIPAPARSNLTSFQPIPAKTEDVPAPAAPSPSRDVPSLPGSLTRPAIPSAIAEYYLPASLSMTEAARAAGEPLPQDAQPLGLLYRAGLLAAARVRLFDRKLGVDSDVHRAALVDAMDKRGVVRWEDFSRSGLPLDRVENRAQPGARFETPETSLTDARLLASLQKDFGDWVYRTTSVMARANETLKVYAGPDVTAADFRTACAEAARAARDAEIARQAAALDRQIATLRDRLSREERELAQDEREYQNRKWEENATHAENVFGLFTGKGSMRKVSSSMTKRRMTEQAKAEVDESVEAIQQYQAQLEELERRRAEMEQAANDRWASVVNQVTEIPVAPKKTDVFIEYFGVAWMPFYILGVGNEIFELPAFGAG
jgi:flagellar biosynthesis chaperone FliJ